MLSTPEIMFLQWLEEEQEKQEQEEKERDSVQNEPTARTDND